MPSQRTSFEQVSRARTLNAPPLRIHDQRETLQSLMIAAGGGSVSAAFIVIALMAGTSTSTTLASGDVSELSAVEADSLANAATTLDPNVSGELIAQAKACRAPLAQITVSTDSGMPPQTIRVRSGSYVSLEFQVTGAPRRIAIPFPAPYPVGRGVISIIGDTRNVAASLSPTWRVGSASAAAVRNVVWKPGKPC